MEKVEYIGSDEPIYADPSDSEIKRNLQINEEYKVWKKNAPFLYDMVITTSLDWPSLTCQWFPDIDYPEGKDYSVQRLLLGTNTSKKEMDYLQIATVTLPKAYEKEVSESEGGYGSAKPKVSITHKFNHEGEVNRARYCPQNPDLIASFSSTGKVFVFDRTKHPSIPSNDTVYKPDMELIGHEKEGFGLSWNPLVEGQILTGAYDNTVRLWDITTYTKGNTKINPSKVFGHHTNLVEDVAWNFKQPTVFGSVSDDQHAFLWDTRKGDDPTHQIHAHNDNVNCIAFNPFNEVLFATASADKTVALWDMRNLSMKIHTLLGHQDEVRSLDWSPTEPTILASAGCDRRLIMWDMSKIGAPQTEEDAEDGPPELLFLHGGHTSQISDCSFNPHSPYTMASCDEDNVVEIWQVAHNLISNEDEDQ